MKDFETFRDSIKKVKGPRHHKISNSYGVYDYYKYYRKIKPKDNEYILNESQYFAIIRMINEKLGNELVQGNDIAFPLKMGVLELRKRDVVPRINAEGKVVYKSVIDWNTTLKLWCEDEESYRKKTIVYFELKEAFKVIYNKRWANYKNKSAYKFNLNRDLKRRISIKVREGRLDAFGLIK